MNGKVFIHLKGWSQIKPSSPAKPDSTVKGGGFMDLKNGEGKVIDRNGQKVAAYKQSLRRQGRLKDDDGKIHAVSANCTYEGCVINWSQAEKIWTCPCCGSKFGIDGKVLQGPATEDLKKVEV